MHERGNEKSSRLARSEGSLYINEKVHPPSFAKNPRYVRRFKGKKHKEVEIMHFSLLFQHQVLDAI